MFDMHIILLSYYMHILESQNIKLHQAYNKNIFLFRMC